MSLETELNIVVPARPANEPMDLPTARAVLGQIVSTHEGSLSSTSDLTQIGPYTTQQIRDAFLTTALDITHRGASAQKDTTEGALRLSVENGITANQKFTQNSNLHLRVIRGGNFRIESSVPLVVDNISLRANKFNDYRRSPWVIAHFEQSETEAMSFDTLKSLWRGMRWTAANLLHWDKDVILPEDIDEKPPYTLPQPSTKFLTLR